MGHSDVPSRLALTKWHILTEEETEERIELIHDKLSVALSKAQSLSKLEWKEMHILVRTRH